MPVWDEAPLLEVGFEEAIFAGNVNPVVPGPSSAATLGRLTDNPGSTGICGIAVAE